MYLYASAPYETLLCVELLVGHSGSCVSSSVLLFNASRAIELSIGNKDMINKPAIVEHANNHFLTNHDYAAEAAELVATLNNMPQQNGGA